MQADAKHQQDDADLGQLARDLTVGMDPRRERPDRNAREEIPDERRNVETAREKPKCEGHDEGRRQREQQRRLVVHEGGGGSILRRFVVGNPHGARNA
jgi:hypothetical protein